MSRTFKAATWNVFHGTKPDALKPALDRMLKDGVSIFLLQEVTTPALRQVFHDAGLRVHFTPRQYAVAYDPEVWVRVAETDEVLAETDFFTPDGHRMPTNAASVILSDRVGRTLTALSYHTAAHVQVPEAQRPPRRITSIREAMATLKRLADQAETRAILFGGDDNVDERRAFSAFFSFMKDKATGLRTVRAPEGTHGSRKIDDFRVRGLKPGKGYTVPNASDHDAHVHAFRWA